VIGWFHQLEFVMGSCNIKIESLFLLSPLFLFSFSFSFLFQVGSRKYEKFTNNGDA
jgi:hypothetical protein